MANTTKQEQHALVSYFGKKYKERYGFAPKLNRYAALWGFDSILRDMSPDDARGLIDYYFETISPGGHDLTWFFYNYDKLAEAKERRDKDAAALAEIRRNSALRAEEWRKKKRGNN